MDSGEFVDDASSKLGAQRLADRIVAFWRARGYPSVVAGIVETTPPSTLMAWDPTLGKARSDRRPIYTIVSNIGYRGYPPASAAT
jgi:hypothetical protein